MSKALLTDSKWDKCVWFVNFAISEKPARIKLLWIFPVLSISMHSPSVDKYPSAFGNVITIDLQYKGNKTMTLITYYKIIMKKRLLTCKMHLISKQIKENGETENIKKSLVKMDFSFGAKKKINQQLYYFPCYLSISCNTSGYAEESNVTESLTLTYCCFSVWHVQLVSHCRQPMATCVRKSEFNKIILGSIFLLKPISHYNNKRFSQLQKTWKETGTIKFLYTLEGVNVST